jgi:small-conductance mechanosensitive channel
MASVLAELISEYSNLDLLTSEIIASIIIFAVAMITGWIVYSVFRRYLSRWARTTKTKIDDEIIRNTRAPVLLLALLVGAFYGLESLSLLQPYSDLLAALFTVGQVLIVTFIITRITNVLISWFAKRARREKRLSEHILFVLKRIIQATIYTFAFLVILVAFRIDLSGVVVGLGVGGIAIALALQTVLGDVFSAFSIYFDRPFEVGDFIVVGDFSGTVRKIGVKSTRLELLQGEELIISNRELTQSSVRNFKKLKKRRIIFRLNVDAGTSLEKLKRIPSIVSDIIRSVESAEFDRIHFTKFGEFSLEFEIVYYMKTPDYVKYMDTQQTINFAIIEVFEKEGIKMPFPTQTILLQNTPSQADSSEAI